MAACPPSGGYTAERVSALWGTGRSSHPLTRRAENAEPPKRIELLTFSLRVRCSTD